MTDHPSALVSVPVGLMRESLKAAEQFIVNGVELGYVRMPDYDDDPAHSTLPMIRNALALLLAAPAAPQAAGVGEDDGAKLLWNRFAVAHHESWDDEPNKAEYRQAAADVLALRAQPPAREDAQPFGYWVEHTAPENPALTRPPMMIRYGSFVPASDHYKITTLYTRPAPDALRVAVEALKPFAAEAQRIRAPQSAETIMDNVELCQCGSVNITRTRLTCGDLRKATEALAALQAEQGAK